MYQPIYSVGEYIEYLNKLHRQYDLAKQPVISDYKLFMADALNAIISAFSDQKFIEKMQSAIEHINDYAFENLDPRETPEIKGKFMQCFT